MSGKSDIDHQIDLFLRDDQAEILCMTGDWGIGKTTMWRQKLSNYGKTCHKQKPLHSYVSLFGLNSPGELRIAIFAQTKRIKSSLQFPIERRERNQFGNWFISWRKWVQPIITLISRNTAINIETAISSTFLTVQSQLICIDDIERAGDGLKVQDVLGLAQFLKEERNCKVVLVLNEKKISENQRDDFFSAIEKVADVRVRFDPSIENVLDIAFPNDTIAATLIRPNAAKLNITNIRVLKKIERSVLRLLEILLEVDHEVVKQSVGSLVFGCWCVLQPHLAPPLKFVKVYRPFSNLFLNGTSSKGGDNDKEWRSILSTYYGSTFELGKLELEIFAAAELGYLNEDEIIHQARIREKQLKFRQGGEKFSKVWEEQFYGSLTVDDRDFAQDLYDSVISDAKYISLSSMNSTVQILREFGDDNRTDDLIEYYLKSKLDVGSDFFNPKELLLSADEIDEKLKEELKRLCEISSKNIVSSIKSILLKTDPVRIWVEEDILSITRMTSDQIELYLRMLKGTELHIAINTILMISRENFDSSKKLKNEARVAFKNIASEHTLNRSKLERLGVKFVSEIND